MNVWTLFYSLPSAVNAQQHSALSCRGLVYQFHALLHLNAIQLIPTPSHRRGVTKYKQQCMKTKTIFFYYSLGFLDTFINMSVYYLPLTPHPLHLFIVFYLIFLGVASEFWTLSALNQPLIWAPMHGAMDTKRCGAAGVCSLYSTWPCFVSVFWFKCVLL